MRIKITLRKLFVLCVLMMGLSQFSFAQKPLFLKANILDSALKDVTSISNTTYFKIKQGNYFQVWKTNGTIAGTVLIKDSFEFVQNLVNLNNSLFFLGKSVYGQSALFKSDGTTSGTLIVKSFTGNNVDLSGLSVINGVAYFSVISTNPNAGSIWKTDGTILGTVEIKSNLFVKSAKDKYQSFYKAGNSIVFSTYNLNNSYVALWSTDGSSAGTNLLKDSAFFYTFSRISDAAGSDSLLLFLDNTGNAGNLWRTNGTKAGTYVLRGGTISQITSFQNEFYFLTGTIYKALNKTNGSSYNAINGLTNVGNSIGVFGNQLILAGKDNNDWEPYLSDGTSANTSLLKNISNSVNGSNPRYFTKIGNNMFFVANNNIHGDQIWKTNGTSSGTIMAYAQSDTIANINTFGLYHCNNYLLFVSNQKLYALDVSGSQSIFENEEKQRLAIFPNPSNGTFNIDYQASKEAKTMVYNSLGELVYSEEFSNSFSLENLKAGIYYLNVLDNGRNLYSKIVLK